ncbi:Coproporphyrinogen oxidase [Mycena venus]|uniref:coproporphyrinogen oxidase n=1 Tax=Mycena venus TaxID=2733690 RepID=A0A8H6XQ81_9AGAR|nr:Coproporphyrinogen oxidase [Mycena venus]
MAESTPTMRTQMEEYIVFLQNQIISAFEALDPASPPFKRDSWLRAEGGSGQSCAFTAPPDNTTSVLEKAGVNISIIHGTLGPQAIKQMRANHSSMPLPEDTPGSLPFFVAGISLVVHPRNPHAPTVHMNCRYFEITQPATEDGQTQSTPLAWWFGGGSDLTPTYLYDEDAIHFHSTLKSVCDAHSDVFYPTFKSWCDEYFYIPHRNEVRGIGGIFFDDMHGSTHSRLPPASESAPRPQTPADLFKFVRGVGDAFLPAYMPILSRRLAMPFTPEQRRWQLLRHGRYVEFDLVHDRGTKFGLVAPGARIESILMTMPETARWEYMTDMGKEGTEEGRLLGVLKTPRAWV